MRVKFNGNEGSQMDIKRHGGNGRRSQCVEYGGLLYTSGITSTDLEGDITAQCQDVFRVIDQMLARRGIDKNRILTATITLADMKDYGDFNAAWDAWVIDAYEPARSVTEGALAIPEFKVKVAVVAAL